MGHFSKFSAPSAPKSGTLIDLGHPPLVGHPPPKSSPDMNINNRRRHWSKKTRSKFFQYSPPESSRKRVKFRGRLGFTLLSLYRYRLSKILHADIDYKSNFIPIPTIGIGNDLSQLSCQLIQVILEIFKWWVTPNGLRWITDNSLSLNWAKIILVVYEAGLDLRGVTESWATYRFRKFEVGHLSKAPKMAFLVIFRVFLAKNFLAAPPAPQNVNNRPNFPQKWVTFQNFRRLCRRKVGHLSI